MKKILLSLVLIMFAGSAFAHSCPRLMSEIDAVLEGDEVESHIEADVLTEAMSLREQGEAYHDDGDHDRAMEALEKALELLAIEG
ncbi:tetratricopeptide (TPR) repeat protein [Natronocella acetinitrilica]|uniref:Tetratricopeptide (TPR) repeat protein n=1 Tax=Natronocella acetinitrilica TaxID=414046 RepID=A0AAE3G3W8_9GAMM|nr:tetratricopeptide repeat protein [Natronocella acetinitrilica]MCP1675189.1 tetratricopeptide (TPR) repeat protein [Natronocella acetinitrilica]